jgi:hypothetical protein
VNQFDIDAKEVHDSFNGKYLNGKVASMFKYKIRYLFCLSDFSDNSAKARGYVQHGIYQNVNN